MLDRKAAAADPTPISADNAEGTFSELIARAAGGESFVVTKNGNPVARITPIQSFDREKAREAGNRILARLAAQGPRVSEEEAQRNWEKLKADVERERDERVDRWLKS
jgi:prevent-host-death family protein